MVPIICILENERVVPGTLPLTSLLLTANGLVVHLVSKDKNLSKLLRLENTSPSTEAENYPVQPFHLRVCCLRRKFNKSLRRNRIT